MKRALTLTALALATVASVATSQIDLGAFGSTDAVELGAGELTIATSGVEGENRVDGVWIDVEVNADIEGRLTDRVDGLQVQMVSESLQGPLVSEVLPLDEEGRLVGGAFVEAVELYRACESFPTCEDTLEVELTLVDAAGQPVEFVRATGEMFILVNIQSAGFPEEDDGIARVHDIQLDWQPLP